jgi:hypothetical protein
MAYVARLLSAGLEPCAPCRPIPQLALRLTPIPQLTPPTKSNVAPWPMPFPLKLGSILPHPGDNAHQQESSPPTLLCNPPTRKLRSTADTNSTNAAACSANSWKCCASASLANAFTRAAVSWQGHLLASSAAASSANIAAHDAANSDHILFTAKSVAVFIAAAVFATARSTAAWLSQDKDK